MFICYFIEHISKNIFSLLYCMAYRHP